MTPRPETIEPGSLSRLARGIRSLIDTRYRRAARSLRDLPRIEYRTVIDAGAHQGLFTDALLALHQPSRVVLLEANPELAAKLQEKFATRPGCSVVAAALSDTNGEAEFKINRSNASSSLLQIDPRNTEWFGRNLSVERTVRIPTITLPQLVKEQQLEQIDLLKLDLQGSERTALVAGEAVLGSVRAIYSEVFFEQLYEGAWLFWEMNDFLAAHGFKLCGLHGITHGRDGTLLQANAIFRRV